MLPTELLLRASTRLQEAWRAEPGQARREEQCLLARLADRQRRLERARQRLEKALDRGLALIIPGLREEFLGQLRAVQETAHRLDTHLEPPETTVPNSAFLAAELRQLEEEFTGLEIDWKKKVLRVVTEPVTLRDIYLGPFAIELPWSRLASREGSSSFDIIALDPNPAAADALVTHPHVKDKELCAGEAKAPLRRALEQGRLADAFILVRSVLEQYNPASPHISLDRWSGIECHDCGHGVAEDDLHRCDGCEEDYCGECIVGCSACDRSRCAGCLTGCAVCNRRCCGHCLEPSAHSGRDCCPRCRVVCVRCDDEVASDELDAGTQLCPSCSAPRPPASAEPETPSPDPAQSPDPLEPEAHHASPENLPSTAA